MMRERLPGALHHQMLVGPIAMAVARQQRADAVELHDDGLGVIDVAGDDAIDVLLDPPAEAVIGIIGGRQVGEIDLGQLVPDIVAVGGHVSGDFVGLGGEITIVVIGVGKRVVLGQAVGGVGDVAGREVRGGAIEDPFQESSISDSRFFLSFSRFFLSFFCIPISINSAADFATVNRIIIIVIINANRA